MKTLNSGIISICMIVLLCGCEMLEDVWYNNCQSLVTNPNICPCEEDTDIEDQPYQIQALNCGGAADVFGNEDFASQSIIYTDTAGMKVIYHRFIFTDSSGTQLFTCKFASYEVHEEGAEGFIVAYDDPNREPYYMLEIMEEQDTADPNVKIGLCHQHKECPGLPTNQCNFPSNSYPNTPAKIVYCEGDFIVGQFLGIVVEQ